MIRRRLPVYRLLQIDIPDVLASGRLPLVFQGPDRYGFHAFPLILAALRSSGDPDRKSSHSLLALSDGIRPGLITQEMVRIWLRFLDDAAESGPDDAADRASIGMESLIVRLADSSGSRPWNRLFRPAAHADRMLAVKWMPLLSLSIDSRRTRVDGECYERCENAYHILLGRTGATEFIDRLFLPVRYFHAVQSDDKTAVHRIAEEWARMMLPTAPAEAGRFMMLNLKRLEIAPDSPESASLDPGALLEEAMAAVSSYREILPEDYDLLVAQARLKRRAGDFAGCLAACALAVELRPDGYAAYCVRSNLRFLTEEYALAREDAETACRLAPDKAQGFIARAFVRLHDGEYDEALRDFETALRIDPQRLDAMHGRGKCLSLLGEDEEAMSCFNRLRRILPDDPDIAYELADAMFAAGFLEDALRVCLECLALDPAFTEAYVLMAVVETRKENDGLAFDHLEKALEIEADNPFALNEMAYLLHLQGRDGEAFDYVEQALDSFPDFTEALYNKATILYFQGLLDESYDLYDRILNDVPDHVSALIGKANVLTQMSELDEALACYDEALKIFPKSSEACLGKATVYRMMGLEEDGREWQEKARSLDGDLQ